MHFNSDVEVYDHGRALLDEASLAVLGKTADQLDLPSSFYDNLTKTLKEVSAIGPDVADSLRGHLGAYHLKIGASLSTTIVAAIAAALALHTVDQITPALIAGQVLSYLTALKGQLTKLSAGEREIFEAVASVMQRKADSGRVLESKGANEKEIWEAMVESPGSRSEHISHSLEDLIIKGVLNRSHTGSGKPEYICVF